MRKIYLYAIIATVFLMVGCTVESTQTETIQSIKINPNDDDYLFGEDQDIVVETDRQTYVWRKKVITVYKTKNDDDKNIVKYKTLSDGSTHASPEIYLNKQTLKEFSTEYAETFSQNLRVKEPK